MPSCCAVGCSARSRKGQYLTFKIFPRKDKIRRKIWIDRVKRPGWTASRYSVLCELHFDSDQWEGQEGRRKLKKNAVPTVFHVALSNHLVAIDHPYCQTGLRKIYDLKNEAKSKKAKNGTKEPKKLSSEKTKKNENVKLPEFEHVEVSDGKYEHSIFTPELPFLKCEPEEAEANSEVKVKNEPAEDIQCTPDICMWPESDDTEPDPIEMVQCQYGEISPHESEPCKDPLAISADDMLDLNKALPNFAHTTKYLFVPKTMKPMPASMSFTATGEPQPVASADNKGKIKLVSTQRLLLPKSADPGYHYDFKAQPLSVVPTPKKVNVVLPYAVDSSNIKSEPSSVDYSPANIQLPESTLNITPKIVKRGRPPKLTPAPFFHEQPKPKIPPKDVIQTPQVRPAQFVNVPLPKLQEAPKLFKISDVIKENSSDASPASTVVKPVSDVKPMSHVKPVIPIPAKASLSLTESKPSSDTTHVLSSIEGKRAIKLQANDVRVGLSKRLGKNVIYIKNKKIMRPIFVRKPSISYSNQENKMAFLKSMEHFAQLENISQEHEYSSNLSWKPLSVKGFKLIDDSLHSSCGKKLYPLSKIWDTIKSKSSLIKSESPDSNGSVKKEIESPKKISLNLSKPSHAIPNVRGSSVLVINPYEKTKTSVNLTQASPIMKLKKEDEVTDNISHVKKTAINRQPTDMHHLKLYKCELCKYSFLTPASLQIHVDSHNSTKVEPEATSDTDTADEHGDDSNDGGNDSTPTIVSSWSLADTKKTEISPGSSSKFDPIKPSSSAVDVPAVKVEKKKESLKRVGLRVSFKGFGNTDLAPLPLKKKEEEKRLCSLKEDGNKPQNSSQVRYSLRRKNAPSLTKPSRKEEKQRRSKRSEVKLINSQDKTGKPIHSQDKTVKPIHSQDKTVKPINSQDKTVKTIHSQDKTVKSIHSQDKTVKTIHPQDKTVKTSHPQDKTVKPIHSQDKTVKPIHSQDKTVKPNRPEDKTDRVLKSASLKKDVFVPKPLNLRRHNLRKKDKSIEPAMPVHDKRSKFYQAIAELKREKRKLSILSSKTRSGIQSKSKNDPNVLKNKKTKPNKLSTVNTKCPTCGMKVEESSLKKHLLQHISVEINLYTCTICSKRFSKSYQLRKHTRADHKMKKAEKDFKCPDFKCPKRYCNRAFESKRMLLKHTIISHKK